MDQKTLENELKNCKVRQGPLYKRSKFLKEWRERWVVLSMNYLFTFTNKSCKEVTDIIDLKQVKSYKSYLRKDQEMIPAGFKVRSDDQQFYFCGRNCNQKWSWIVTLERLMDYKYVGSSTYNNIEFIKSRGFMSQIDFENGGKVQKSSAPQKETQAPKKSAEQAKKSVDNQVEAIMKELENQKQQLKQKELEFTEKQKVLKEQEIALKKQQQQTIKQLQKKLSEAAESPKKPESQPVKVAEQPKKKQQTETKIENKASETSVPAPHLQTKSSVSEPKTEQSLKAEQEKPVPIEEIHKVKIGGGSKVSELKNLYEQKMAASQSTVPNIKLTFDTSKNSKKKSVIDQLYSLRSRTVTNLFEEFHDASPEPEALKFTLDFLVKMASDNKFGYDTTIVVEAKSHKNRKFFADIFVELITDYRDLENCHLLARFIEVCVFQAPGFFKENHIPIIKSKLLDFFLAVDDENKLEIILKTIFIVNNIQKYQKNELVKSKLERMTKEAKKEENKNWARKLTEDF